MSRVLGWLCAGRMRGEAQARVKAGVAVHARMMVHARVRRIYSVVMTNPTRPKRHPGPPTSLGHDVALPFRGVKHPPHCEWSLRDRD